MSCSPKVYIPDQVPVPLVDRKSEAQLNVYGSMEQFGGWGLNGHYAVTNHLFITGGYFTEKQSNINSNTFDKIQGGPFRYHFYEGGAGYYYAAPSHLRFGSFLTSGNGDVDASFPVRSFFRTKIPQQYDVSARFGRFSGTVYVGRGGNICEVGMALRFSYMHFYEYHFAQYFIANPSDRLYDDNQMKDNLFVEPAFTLNVGYKPVKFSLQLGFSIPANGQPEYEPYYPFIMTAGCYVKLFADGKKWPQFKESD
jgi:hypothetical protein